jgi:hypothetical protein
LPAHKTDSTALRNDYNYIAELRTQSELIKLYSTTRKWFAQDCQAFISGLTAKNLSRRTATTTCRTTQAEITLRSKACMMDESVPTQHTWDRCNYEIRRTSPIFCL